MTVLRVKLTFDYQDRPWFANKRIFGVSLVALSAILTYMFQQFLQFGTIIQMIQTTIKASASDFALNATGEFTLANGTFENLKNSTNFLHIKTRGKCSAWEK